MVDTQNGIADEIFDVLVKNNELEMEDLIKIFENHNSYIFGMEDEKTQRAVEKQLYQAVKNINYTYQISKVNFIWKQKVSENNKIVSEQLNTVSKVINNMAKEMEKPNIYKKNEDNFKLNIGISKTTKNKSKISGDTSTQMKLKDGKFLLALSDGMGTGEKARNSSKKAISILENMLLSGFNKDESIELINSALTTNFEDEMYATLDICILDLNTGNAEFVKTGACPTFIKSKGVVQVLKDFSAPAGMVSEIDLVTYDRDLDDGDIIVMCTDGVIDSIGQSDENWLKEMLEGLHTDNVQQIADLIIREAIDNGLGIARDDMTIMVVQINKKEQST